MDEAAWTTVLCIVTDEATMGTGSVVACFRRDHRTAAVVVASTEQSVRTAVADVGVAKAAGGEGGKLRPSLRIRSQDGCGVRCFREQGLVCREGEREGELGAAAADEATRSRRDCRL